MYTRKLLTQIDGVGTTERAYASNVVIMKSELQDSQFGDKFGARTPYPYTIGSGSGIVLLDGKLIDATWNRASARDLPHWYNPAGVEIPLRRKHVVAHRHGSLHVVQPCQQQGTKPPRLPSSDVR